MCDQSGYPTTEPLVTGQSTLTSELLCEEISLGWENHHKVCEILGQ